MRGLRALAGLAGAAVLGLRPGAAAPPHQQAPPTFRAGIDVVQVDVSVLDRDRRPARGLAASDFTILENGRPQEIVAFVPVDVPDPELPPARWIRDVAPDVRSNELGDGRLFAVIMDDATAPPDARITSEARRIGRSIVDRLGPADLAAVVHVVNTRASVDFTNDRQRLFAAVEAFAPSFAYADQVGPTDSRLFFSSIRTLGLVAGQLASVPQRRKAVVYVSTGIPLDLEKVAGIFSIGGPRTAPLGQGVSGSTLDDQTAGDLLDAVEDLLSSQPDAAYGFALEETFVRAQHGNVNIYSIDPGGLGGLQAFLQDRVARGAAVGAPRLTAVQAFQDARLHQDFLRTVAENSGGRAIVDSNDLADGVARIFRENSSYYLIGYRSTRDPADRTVRRVTVSVKGPGLTAETRNAYFDPRTRPRRPAADVSGRLGRALGGILPTSDLALRASAVPFAQPGRPLPTVAVVLGLRHAALPGDAGARATDTLDILTSAFTLAGDARGSTRQTARLVGRSGVGGDVEYDVLTQIDLPPGRYQVRVAAHSAALDRSGSVYVDVEVPDFSRDGLSMSGLVLSSDPAVPAAPDDAFALLLPLLPTSKRDFGPATDVTAYVRLYQGGRAALKPVSIALRLTNDRDVVVARVSSSVAAADFGPSRAADYRARLPLGPVPPGAYLLTIEASAGGRPIRRDLRFEVVR
jgi:VWFA-related protein